MKKQHIILAALAIVIALTAFTGCKKQQPEDNTPAPEGLYLGIIGFNNELTTLPLGLLNQATKHNFANFVDGLTMQNGTYLYHAVNTGINNLAAAKIPENLINVSVVTFTDGLDQGSYTLSPDNTLSAINTRIKNERIGGLNISAYSIGVRGSDVGDIESFRENLNKLSSDPEHNVFEVDNMSEASEKFAQIARELYSQSTFYNVTFTMSPQNPGDKIRFTFDNVSDATQSQRYIEATYNRTPNNLGQLTNIEYVGLECRSGNVITANSFTNNYDDFSFRDLFDSNGNQVTTENVKLWNWNVSAEYWGQNSEFTPSGSTETVNEYKSAMIMLMLDCSSSLGSDFVNMKTAANSFIENLSGNYNGRR